MSFVDGVKYRLRALFGRERFEQDMKDEFDFHLSLDAAHQGHPPDAARRRLGNRTRLEEERREQAGLGFVDVLRQDLTFGWRSLTRAPGFTVVAVLALGIGIGANTAIFSAVNALLLRPLPFDRPEELMQLSLVEPTVGGQPGNDDVIWSYPKHEYLRGQQQLFSAMALYTDVQLTVRTADEAFRQGAELTDEHYFPVLHVTPQLGRNFLPGETVPHGPRVVILSDGYWQRQFNRSPDVLERSVNIQGNDYRVIGVMPAGFRGITGQGEFWIPIASLWGESMLEPWSHGFASVARLKPGIPAERAKAMLREIGPRITEAFPNQSGVQAGWQAMARDLDATRVDPIIRRSVLVLFGTVSLVLLIACVNVANLLLIRASGRRREIAVRIALGAGRGRIVRQLLTESLMLALMGAAVGLGLAWWGVQLLAQLDPASALRGEVLAGIGVVNFTGIALDGAALGFTALVALATGVLFGLVPALQATRPSPGNALSMHPTRRWHGWSTRDILAVTEIALALILLIGSGLVLRSLGRLMAVDPGFNPNGVLSLRLNTETGRDSLPAFYDDLTTRLAQLPGVQRVGLSDCLPLSGGCNGTVLTYRDRPSLADGSDPRISINWITPDWLGTMGVPLIRGRGFESTDRMGTRKVVLINDAAARAYWPGEDPIGRRVSVGQGGFHEDTALVVGVVGDVRYTAIDQAATPHVYLPYAQSPRGRMTVQLRVAGDPAAVAASARAVLRQLAPLAPVYDVQTMTARLSDARSYARFSALVLGLFAATALALATMGIYGVISFGVSQRTRELGIRAALGADRWDVVRLVARQGALMAVIGGVLGLGGALLLSRALGAMLYGVPSNDPLTFAVVAVVMLLAVAAASLVPARRAAAVPPAEALRRV